MSTDLNLLAVFQALAKDLNTTKAAKRLGLSQPAVSHALNRLRETFHDPLFVRAARGLTPTNKALELVGPIDRILADAEALLVGKEAFNPAKFEGEFRIATTDYFEVVALPKILKRLSKEAPGIRIISRPVMGALPKENLENGTIDLAIAGYFGELPEGFYQQNVFKDDFVCVAKKGNAHFKPHLTMTKYAAAQHLLISPQGDMKSRSSAVLKKHKLTQFYKAGVSSFISPGWMICEADLLLTCPRKLAEAYQKHLPVEIAKLPFTIDGISVVQVWHGRHHKDAAHAWLRTLIKEVCSEL